MHAEDADPPDTWEDYLTFNRRFQSPITSDLLEDQDAEAPDLANEWLTPEELHDRKQKRIEKRAARQFSRVSRGR